MLKTLLFILCFFYLSFTRAEEIVVSLNNITINKIDKDKIQVSICTSYPWVLYYQKQISSKNKIEENNNRVEIFRGKPVQRGALDLFTINVENISLEKSGFFVLINLFFNRC